MKAEALFNSWSILELGPPEFNNKYFNSFRFCFKEVFKSWLSLIGIILPNTTAQVLTKPATTLKNTLKIKYF